MSKVKRNVLLLALIIGCKPAKKEDLAETSSVYEQKRNKFTMLSAKVYGEDFKPTSAQKPESRYSYDADAKWSPPKHICFFETKWEFNKDKKKLQDIIKPTGFSKNPLESMNPFDSKKLTQSLTEKTVNWDNFSNALHKYIGDGYGKYRDEARAVGAQRGAIAGIPAGVVATILTGGVAFPTIGLTSGAGAVLGSAVGDFLFHQSSKGLRVAENIGSVESENALDVNDKTDLDTETSYQQLKKMVTENANLYKEVGKNSRKCEDLLPKDNEWREKLRDLSTSDLIKKKYK